MVLSKLREQLDKKEISALELTKKYLDNIEKFDEKVCAYIHVGAEEAYKEAEQAQKLIDAKESKPLTGIPIGIKDNICTKNMPTTCASKMLEGYTAPYDATVVSKLREEGAVIVGKLNLDEYAMGSTTDTSYFGRTNNPYNLKCVPGGSSGGSAAAVAAQMCAAALGSDTGGSIRQPSSFCGVTGIRPTYGMVSRSGGIAFASSLDQIGPIANSARDCATILQAISGPCRYDQTSIYSKPLDVAFGESVKGKKLAIIKELMTEDVDAEIREHIEKSAKWFENAGATISYVSIPMIKYVIPTYYLLSSAEASTNLSRFDGIRYGHRALNLKDFDEIVSTSRAEGFGWEVKRRIMLGTYALCSGFYDDYYKKALDLANVIKNEYNEIFKTHDALLSPVSPTVAYEFDKIPKDPVKHYLADICTVSASIAHLPSLSTPCGYNKDGMPIGLMITGRKWEDGFILSLADSFESEFTRREPEVMK